MINFMICFYFSSVYLFKPPVFYNTMWYHYLILVIYIQNKIDKRIFTTFQIEELSMMNDDTEFTENNFSNLWVFDYVMIHPAPRSVM